MKQVIVLRKDLNMRKGKMVAQGCHASLCSLMFPAGHKASQDTTKDWFKNGQKKICVGVESEEELKEVFDQAFAAKLPCYHVLDSGITEFGEPTYTAVGIGPADEKLIDKITGGLKLL